jgi:hypothetical protein
VIKNGATMMGKSCCAKPIAKIIRVANFEAGIVGLEDAFRNVSPSGLTSEKDLANELLKWVKEFGNYISPMREDDYKMALLREYRLFASHLDRGLSARQTR